jgi:hypothetical protein
MGIFFSNFKQKACCLCGSKDNLTREHKIKASLLREEFGTNKMAISSFGQQSYTYKYVQGVQSDRLKFKASMCSVCNNALTQPADVEFDKFNKMVLLLIAEGLNPELVFDNERYAIGSYAYLNVFRYFAKLLCCHLSEEKAPLPKRLARFATGQSNLNYVWLGVYIDFDLKRIQEKYSDFQYASHSGLKCNINKKTYTPNMFKSTLTIGFLLYEFHWNLHTLEEFELRFFHSKFCKQIQILLNKNPIRKLMVN